MPSLKTTTAAPSEPAAAATVHPWARTVAANRDLIVKGALMVLLLGIGIRAMRLEGLGEVVVEG